MDRLENLLPDGPVAWVAFIPTLLDYDVQLLLGEWPGEEFRRLRYQWRPLYGWSKDPDNQKPFAWRHGTLLTRDRQFFREDLEWKPLYLR